MGHVNRLELCRFSRRGTTRLPRCSLHRTCYGRRGGKKGFPKARQFQIVCFAHVTNQMGQSEGDFEKGEASGSETTLSVVSQTARCWRHRQVE